MSEVKNTKARTLAERFDEHEEAISSLGKSLTAIVQSLQINAAAIEALKQSTSALQGDLAMIAVEVSSMSKVLSAQESLPSFAESLKQVTSQHISELEKARGESLLAEANESVSMGKSEKQEAISEDSSILLFTINNNPRMEASGINAFSEEAKASAMGKKVGESFEVSISDGSKATVNVKGIYKVLSNGQQ